MIGRSPSNLNADAPAPDLSADLRHRKRFS